MKGKQSEPTEVRLSALMRWVLQTEKSAARLFSYSVCVQLDQHSWNRMGGPQVRLARVILVFASPHSAVQFCRRPRFSISGSVAYHARGH